VLAVLNNALGFARENGRDTTNTSDLLDALADALGKRVPDTAGMTALRQHWPLATERDGVRQDVTKILEVQSNQLSQLAKALGELGDIRQDFTKILEVQSNQPSMLANLATELKALRDRIATLQNDEVNETPTPPPPWYRRLNVLFAV
jgi:hypothetical protein